MRNQSIRKVRGVTLIELMVTLAVAGVLIALALPSFNEFFAKSRLRGAADDLSNQFAIARLQAQRQDRNVSVTVVGTGATWCSGARQFELASGTTIGLDSAAGDAPACACDSAPANCTVAGDPMVVSSADYSGVDTSAIPGATIQFDRKAGVVSDLTASTVSLRSRDYPGRFRLNVTVSPLGNARVCVPTGFVRFGGYQSC